MDGRAEQSRLVEAARAGDEQAFGELVKEYRPQLQVHCYRMVGSFDDAEDLLQETLLRAWRRRATYEGRAPFRAWLYKIATNACLDFLDRRQRQPLPADPTGAPPPASVPWLQPYPDSLLEQATPADHAPEAIAEQRETIGLAFLVAIQQLPPRQRAVLILRDILGWPAKDTAAALDTSVASANSALQRARPALRQHLPRRRLDWRSAANSTAQERAVLQRYLAALEGADDTVLATLLADDARSGHQPFAGGHVGAEPIWYQGRDTVISAWAPALHGPDAVEFRCLPMPVNRQPGFAVYIRPRGSDTDFHAFTIEALEVADGRIVELTSFAPELVTRFGLPPILPAQSPRPSQKGQ